MKNISNMLARGNLTARERYLLLVKNELRKQEKGKGILTDADEKALENWRAKNNNEAREWNQLNEGWRHTGRMNLEAEFAYKDAQVAYLAQLPIILEMIQYPAYRQMGRYIESLKSIKKVTAQEAARIAALQRDVKLNEGIDFDYAVYQLAFELLSEDDKSRMRDLYGDVETDHQYLDQEEIIANLYGSKTELSQEAKEKLAELAAERSYNHFAKEYQLFHYFACIPLLEIARYFLSSKGIDIAGASAAKNQEAHEDESIYEKVTDAMKTYATKHGAVIQTLLRAACLEWLDHGLLDEYTPLVVCEAELLERWLTAKVKAKETLLRHAESGELALRKRTDEETRKEKLYSKGICDSELEAARATFKEVGLEIPRTGELDEKVVFETFSDMVITGESLYAYKGDYAFAKNFKERADTYDPNLGIVYAEDDPERKGEHLDQEFVICNVDTKGEASWLSVYGMTTWMLSSLFDGRAFFKEVPAGGKTLLAFKSADLEKIFKERQQSLIDGYAALLAIEQVLKRASKIYEADISGHVVGRLMILREYLEKTNEAVSAATNTEWPKKSFFRPKKDPLQFAEDLLIDINDIQPNKKIIQEHEAKFKEIFPGF